MTHDGFTCQACGGLADVELYVTSGGATTTRVRCLDCGHVASAGYVATTTRPAGSPTP
jgi:uncharacterized Zn finger protein